MDRTRHGRVPFSCFDKLMRTKTWKWKIDAKRSACRSRKFARTLDRTLDNYALIEIEAITQLSHSVDGERMSGFVTAAAAGFFPCTLQYVRQYRSRIQSHANPRTEIMIAQWRFNRFDDGRGCKDFFSLVFFFTFTFTLHSSSSNWFRSRSTLSNSLSTQINRWPIIKLSIQKKCHPFLVTRSLSFSYPRE